jgi:hypothetical protein
VAIVGDRELWPFSSYPMFSTPRRPPTVTRLWIVGVREDGTETPLADRAAYRPLAWSHVERVLQRADRARIVLALDDLLARNETRRHEGDPGAPSLAALRLYRLTWTADPWAANRDHPQSRELLGEARGGAR